jgi:hypothetical protein
MRFARCAGHLLWVLLTIVAPARAEERVFTEPMVRELRLDWCLNWATDCGRPAADAWCRSQGYGGGALKFQEARNIGSSSPTRVLNTSDICKNPDCDGFSYIVCVRNDLNTRYINPMLGNERLDWCLNWATDCGKPAADAWCRMKGHLLGSVSFASAEDLGNFGVSTRVLNTNAVCNAPSCDGFQYIVCKGE